MPRSSLTAAVRDRITGANGLIPSNGFPLGQQLETVKAGHLPTQLTRRGIDQKKCKLLSTRRTPRLWSASVPANPSHRRGQFSARRLGRPRVHIQPLLRTVIAAPVTIARRQSLRNITIAYTRRIGGQIEPQGRAGHNDRQKVAFSYADGSRRQRLRGNITISSPRTAAGPRCDLTIAYSFPGYPLRPFLIQRKNRLCKSFPPPAELRCDAMVSRGHTPECERLGKTIAQHFATVKLTLVRRAHRRRRELHLPELRTKAKSAPTESRREPRWGRVIGRAPVAPVSYAYRFTRKRSASLGSSERRETEPAANGWHSGATVFVRAICCGFGGRGRVIGRAHVAPVSTAYRFTRKRSASLGSSERREPEPAAIGWHRDVSVIFRAVSCGIGGLISAAPVSPAHRFTRKRVTVSLGPSKRGEPEPPDNGRPIIWVKGTASTAVSSDTPNRRGSGQRTEPPFPPLPWGGVCPNVVTFLNTEITAYARNEMITRLVPTGTEVTHPLCGPIFYSGQSSMAPQLLHMYSRRSTSARTVLVDENPRNGEDQPIMTAGAWNITDCTDDPSQSVGINGAKP